MLPVDLLHDGNKLEQLAEQVGLVAAVVLQVLIEDVQQRGLELLYVVLVLEVAAVWVHDEQGVEERDLGV